MDDRKENKAGGTEELNSVFRDRQTMYKAVMQTSQNEIIYYILTRGLEDYIWREGDALMRKLFRTDLPFPLRCIDGRLKDFGIATAGAGVLWTPEEQTKVIEKVKAHGIKINGIYRHEGCGAEKLFIQNAMTTLGMTVHDAKKAIMTKAQYLATALGTEVMFAEKMLYSRDHIERALVLIGTEVFDAKAVLDGLYPFQLNARFCPDLETVVKRVELAVQIAFGPTGYGESGFKTAPFLICIIGDPSAPGYDVKSLEDHLQPIIQKYGKQVAIRGWDVPQQFLL